MHWNNTYFWTFRWSSLISRLEYADKLIMMAPPSWMSWILYMSCFFATWIEPLSKMCVVVDVLSGAGENCIIPKFYSLRNTTAELTIEHEQGFAFTCSPIVFWVDCFSIYFRMLNHYSTCNLCHTHRRTYPIVRPVSTFIFLQEKALESWLTNHGFTEWSLTCWSRNWTSKYILIYNLSSW